MTTLLNANLPQTRVLNAGYYFDIASNVGNSYISHACSKLFDLRREETTFLNYIFQAESSERVLEEQNSAAAFILILQDHLRADFPDEWYVNATRAINALGSSNAPFLTLSLSANSFDKEWDLDLHLKMSPAKVTFMKVVAERSKSIGVRGAFAADVLGKLAIKNVEVVGCPSYFANGSRRLVPPIDKATLGTRWLGVTGALRPQRHEARSIYLLQGDIEWPVVELLHRQGGRADDFDPAAYDHPFFKPLVAAAIEDRVKFFTNACAWEHYIATNCFAVAGSRLHGAIVALNAGIPAVVTNADARARETCEYLGMQRFQ